MLRNLCTVATIGAALGGCAPRVTPATQSVPDRASAAVEAAESSPIALYPRGIGGQQALLTGGLTLENGCLYVVESNGRRWVPVFRFPGSHWDGRARSVATRSGTFAVGATVRLGGGELRPAGDAPWVKRPPSTCELTRLWLVTDAL